MPSYRDLAQELNQHAETLCRVLLPHGRRERGEWRVGSIQDESGRSLCVRLSGPYSGYWRDHATGERGDLVDLVALVHGCHRLAAFRWAAEWLGQPRPEPVRQPEPLPMTGSTTPRQWIERLWSRAMAAAGTPVERYLRGRGITLAIPSCLRYLAGCKHGQTGRKLPAMVAAVSGLEGELMAVHRTYLADGGQGKANVEPAKASLGPVSNGAVRLAPPAEHLGLAEGIETALSAMQLTGIPTWSCLSAGGLRTVKLPSDVRRVTIFADRDRAGLLAARDARARFAGEGRQVKILAPAECNDFNDMLQEAR